MPLSSENLSTIKVTCSGHKSEAVEDEDEPLKENKIDAETELETLETPKANIEVESKKPETTTIIEEGGKLWVVVLSGNHNPGNGMTIEFVTPKVVDGEIVVENDEADIENEVNQAIYD